MVVAICSLGTGWAVLGEATYFLTGSQIPSGFPQEPGTHVRIEGTRAFSRAVAFGGPMTRTEYIALPLIEHSDVAVVQAEDASQTGSVEFSGRMIRVDQLSWVQSSLARALRSRGVRYVILEGHAPSTYWPSFLISLITLAIAFANSAMLVYWFAPSRRRSSTRALA